MKLITTQYMFISYQILFKLDENVENNGRIYLCPEVKYGCLCQAHDTVLWRSVPNFSHIGQEIEELWVEISLHCWVKYDCHCTDFHET
jgi:hypothetical protein